MSEFLFEEFDKNFAEAREKVRLACENPIYQEYATGQGPLYLCDIPTLSDEVSEVVNEYGWPDEVDEVIRAPKVWETDSDFMRSLQQDGTRRIGVNTVLHTLASPLLKDFSTRIRGNDVHGMVPHLHRAHAIAPDLFDGVRVVVNTIAERYDHFKMPSATDLMAYQALIEAGGDELAVVDDPLLDAYLDPHNTDLCQAIHMAYRIMARMIKVDDYSRIRGLTQDRVLPGVIDAHRVMMGWWDD